MTQYDFDQFKNVSITGIKIDHLTNDEQSVLFQQARYCQAMTDADMNTLKDIISQNMIFTHMSGKQQSRDEYLHDIETGHLKYYTIGIANPNIKVNKDMANITFTSILNAYAYGARGTFKMKGTHHYKRINGVWIAVNG